MKMNYFMCWSKSLKLLGLSIIISFLLNSVAYALVTTVELDGQTGNSIDINEGDTATLRITFTPEPSTTTEDGDTLGECQGTVNLAYSGAESAYTLDPASDNESFVFTYGPAPPPRQGLLERGLESRAQVVQEVKITAIASPVFIGDQTLTITASMQQTDDCAGLAQSTPQVFIINIKEAESSTNPVDVSVERIYDDTCESLKQGSLSGFVLTPEQENLLQTCVDNPTPDNEFFKKLKPEEYFPVGDALLNTTKIQASNINSRLLAIRRGGTRKLDSSGVNMRINGEAVPSVIFEGTGGAVYEAGGGDTDPLPDSIFSNDTQEGVYEEEGGAYQVKGGGGGSADDNDLLASSKWGVFVNGDFIFGEKDESTGEQGFDFDSQGITVGADYRMPGDKLVLGMALGYSNFESDFSSQAGGMDLEGLHLSGYGTYMLSDKGYLDTIISVGRNRTEVSRAVLAVGGQESLVTGKPDSREFSISIGGGYDFNRKKLTVTPYGRVDYTRATIDAFQEKTSDPAAVGNVLAISKQELDSTNIALGARATYAISTPKGVFLPQASIEWKHQFNDDVRTIESFLVHDPNQAPFSISSDQQDTDYLNIGIGMSAVLPRGRSGFVYIDSRQGDSDFSETAIRAGIRIEF